MSDGRAERDGGSAWRKEGQLPAMWARPPEPSHMALPGRLGVRW